MYLYKFIGENIKVVTVDGKVFDGKGIGVDDDDDNESGNYSLNIKLNKNDDFIIDLDEPEIKSIEII